MSTSKTTKVCKQLSEGIEIPKPTQAGIYKASMREAEKKNNFRQTLKYKEWALHFDGKKINNEEIQVVVLKE